MTPQDEPDLRAVRRAFLRWFCGGVLCIAIHLAAMGYAFFGPLARGEECFVTPLVLLAYPQLLALASPVCLWPIFCGLFGAAAMRARLERAARETPRMEPRRDDRVEAGGPQRLSRSASRILALGCFAFFALLLYFAVRAVLTSVPFFATSPGLGALVAKEL